MGAGTSGDSGRFNMLAQVLRARPTGGLRMTNEELLASAIDPIMMESGESLAQMNPIVQAESVTNNKRNEMWTANMSLTYKIIKGLTFKQPEHIILTTAVQIYSIKRNHASRLQMAECLMEKLKWDVTNVGQTIIN